VDCQAAVRAGPSQLLTIRWNHRPEPFGYVLLGQGQVVPVRTEARAVVEACDGSATFAQLAARFGQSGLDLLGELWELGMLAVTSG